MKKNGKLQRWIKENTGKHKCECGCGEYVKPTPNRYYENKTLRFVNFHQNRGVNHPHYGDGEITAKGYHWILLHGHPRTTPRGYVKRCWLVIEKKIGRYLCKGEVVHHINGNKLDDRPENLEITNSSDHAKHHNSGPDNASWRGDIDADEVVSLVLSGMSWKKISERLECSETTVGRRLRKWRVKNN